MSKEPGHYYTKYGFPSTYWDKKIETADKKTVGTPEKKDKEDEQTESKE